MIHSTRRATAGDAESIRRLLCDLTDREPDRELFRQYYEANLDSDRNIYIVAMAGDDVVGFLSCHGQLLLHHMGMVYEIQEMVVDGSHRSRGIGRLLLDALDRELAQTAYELVEVTSSIRRTATHRFYIANGFGQTHHKFTKKHKHE